jgi:quercetin dioxygenase-like cupin family protein
VFRLLLCAAVFALGCGSSRAAAEFPRPLKIPVVDPAGADRQVTVLLDAPHVKIVSIALRNGASLPEHVAPVPVIIQAVSGSGAVVLGAERVHIDAGHLASLAPSVPHAVVPDPRSELVLLVMHLRGATP